LHLNSVNIQIKVFHPPQNSFTQNNWILYFKTPKPFGFTNDPTNDQIFFKY